MKKKPFLILAATLLLVSPACRRPAPVAKSADTPVTIDSVFTVSGQLVIGHEVSSFTADGDTLEYWVDDTTGLLQARYEQVVGKEAKPYTPVKASLRVTDCGKSDEGFAAEYDGVYRVEEIIDIAPLPQSDIPDNL